MKLLLDTHALLWLLSRPELLLAVVLNEIVSPSNTLLLSTVSLWEMTIKSAKRALRLLVADITLMATAVRERGIVLLPLEVADLAELEILPSLHKDPFYRALVAQTRRHRLTLVTVCFKAMAYLFSGIRYLQT